MADRNADETTLAKPNYLFLPSSSLEAYKMSGNNIVQKALEKVGKSLSAHRAPNRAIFFLYGLSGAGKSSTLNHLFDNKTSVSISHNVSGTPDVVEYVGTMRSEHWCAENLEISFIDAPGFNDTGGRHQDAENFATIELFIQQHQHLGFHDLGKYLSILSSSAIFYPNIVLIVVDANDERLFGYDTDIGKMLRMLARKRLRIVDVKRPNVVFVMTHVCGIAKGHWKTKLEPKANFLQLLGKRFLKIHAPVVFIDNDYEAWDLPKDGDWTVLHNGESQPLNLYKKCIEVMRLNNDEVGIEATRIYYEQSREIPLVLSHGVKGILYTGKEGDELSQEAVYWFNKVSSSFKELKTTNVDLEIDAFIEGEKAQRDYLLELYPLKYILKERKLTEVKNIASITLPDIENILTPYRLSDLEKQVICKVFNPIEPTPKEVAPMLGCGFNIFEDRILRPVIDTSQTHQLPPYNFIIPEGCRVVDCVNTETICQGVTDFSEFVMETLIKISAEKYHKFANFPLISGYNIIDSKSLPQDDCKISFRIDQTAFLVCLDSGPLRLDLSKKAENLPETFEQDSETNVLDFSNFFKEYGYWVITQATLGGYIEGVLSVDRANALRTDYYTKIRKLVVTHIANTINGAKISETLDSSVDLAEDEQIYQQLLKAELVWKGGNPRYHTSPLGKLTSYSWNAWTESLKLNPTILQHSFIPIPLHSILHSHNHTRAMAIQNAYGHLTDDIVLSKAKAKSALPPPKTRSEASEQSKSEIKGDSCFPGSATVLLDSGRLVCMRDVCISDRVVSVDSEGRVCSSPLYLWGHLDPDSETDFLCIRHSRGELRVSENHLIFVDMGQGQGEGEGRGVPVPAGRVRVGDRLQMVRGRVVQSVEVLEVRSVRDIGIYSPFTLNSCIAVNGIVCSVFAVPPGIVRDISQVHKIGHALFAPLRYSYKTGLCNIISLPMHRTQKRHIYCAWLEKGYSGMKPIERLIFGKTMTEKL